jgi:DnaJ-class molecular chaperone
MQTTSAKGHNEKTPAIVLRKTLPLDEWMSRGECWSIQFEREELCPACYGYARVPYTSPPEESCGKDSSAYRFYDADWDPDEYTIECSACTGEGFTVKDSSLEAKGKEENPSESDGIVNHATPEGYSTTITAEIRSCSKCEGRKRVFLAEKITCFGEQPLTTDECKCCVGTGTKLNSHVEMNIPFPRHFDATTLTSILVLVDQGHQQRANQTPGDVHVIVELKMPKLEMRMVETTVIPRAFTGSPGTEGVEDSSQQGSEEGEEMERNGEVVEEVSVTVPMELQISKGGRDFTLDCDISLKQAICGFTVHVPCYWRTPVRLMGGHVVDPGFDKFSTVPGVYTWTGDMWNLGNIGPTACELCSMPSFLWPRPDASIRGSAAFPGTLRKGGEKLMGKYPGFAPCLFARLEPPKGGNSPMEGGSSSKRKWMFHGCGVTRQRYPEHPGNTIVSFHRLLSHDGDSNPSGGGLQMGYLRVTFNVLAPDSHPENPDVFYRTFSWCCSKLAGCRGPTVRGT